MQRAIRGHFGRTKYAQRRRMVEAQVRLSQRWRGYRTRKVIRKLIEMRHLAATFFQCLWRRNCAKKLALFKRKQRNASILLQRIHRGRLGRRKSDQERDKYIFSRSQSSGIELGRQMLAEHKLHATRLQSEVSLLNQEKTSLETSVDEILDEITQFEEGVKTLEREMYQLTKAESESGVVLAGTVKHELREQKIRLDQEFSFMLSKIADRKEQLKSLENKLVQLERNRQAKYEDLRSFERRLVVLLEAQEEKLAEIHLRQKKKSDGLLNGKVSLSNEGQHIGSHWQGPSEKEKRQAAQLMDSTETLMKFGFMSMSMTYFSSLNMIKAMKTVAVQDTTMAAVIQRKPTSASENRSHSQSSVENGAVNSKAAPSDKAIPSTSKNDYDMQVRSWSVDNVVDWLSSLSLGQYRESFREGAVDGAFLYALTDDDLRNTLGVEHRLHRKKILFSIDCLKGMETNYDVRREENVVENKAQSPSIITGMNMKNEAALEIPLQNIQLPYQNSNLSIPVKNIPQPSSLPSKSGALGQRSRNNLSDMEPMAASRKPDVVMPKLHSGELMSWVRHQKYDKLKEALDCVPNKKFDKLCLKVQYVEGIGTVYNEEYERENTFNKPDEHGNTVLHIAAQNGNLRIAKLLVYKGCNPNHQNCQGHTPGHFAIAYQFFDFASWLFGDTCGADDELLNMYGLGPYDGLMGENGVDNG